MCFLRERIPCYWGISTKKNVVEEYKWNNNFRRNFKPNQKMMETHLSQRGKEGVTLFHLMNWPPSKAYPSDSNSFSPYITIGCCTTVVRSACGTQARRGRTNLDFSNCWQEEVLRINWIIEEPIEKKKGRLENHPRWLLLPLRCRRRPFSWDPYADALRD